MFMIINFGRNPVKGGRPDIDNINMDKVILNTCLNIGFDQRSDIIKQFVLLIVRNSGIVIIEYIIKYTSDMHGIFIVIALIIHPIWVIDE